MREAWLSTRPSKAVKVTIGYEPRPVAAGVTAGGGPDDAPRASRGWTDGDGACPKSPCALPVPVDVGHSASDVPPPAPTSQRMASVRSQLTQLRLSASVETQLGPRQVRSGSRKRPHAKSWGVDTWGVEHDHAESWGVERLGCRTRRRRVFGGGRTLEVSNTMALSLGPRTLGVWSRMSVQAYDSRNKLHFEPGL